jgi:hypothetical protein
MREGEEVVAAPRQGAAAGEDPNRDSAVAAPDELRRDLLVTRERLAELTAILERTIARRRAEREGAE